MFNVFEVSQNITLVLIGRLCALLPFHFVYFTESYMVSRDGERTSFSIRILHFHSVFGFLGEGTMHIHAFKEKTLTNPL